MSKINLAIVEANKHVLGSVEEQIRDLQPGLQRQVEIATIEVELSRLAALVGKSSLAADLNLTDAESITKDIRLGTKNLADFGGVLLDLYLFQQSLQTGFDRQQITNADKDKFESVLLSVIKQVKQLLNYRPDVSAVMDDLTAMKNLRGGPADATAFHDFHVLQMALKSVWMHAFDENLKTAVGRLYEEAFKLYEDAGLTMPNTNAINDVNDLRALVDEIKRLVDPNNKSVWVSPTMQVKLLFPDAVTIWYLLSGEQRTDINRFALKLVELNNARR
jgi:hypothetical protein